MAIWGVFMFLAMLLVGGVGADFMLNEMRRTELQATLDRAVLAAADLDQELDPTEVVEDYFDKAGLIEYLDDVHVDEGLNFRRVAATASSSTNTLFLKTMGVNELPAPAAGTAEENIPNVEISLVLDISGSMRYSNRMNNLKPAAKDFVSTVLRGDAARTTSITVVPYAGQTNPGPAMFEYLGGEWLGGSVPDNFEESASDINEVVLYFDSDRNGSIDYAARINSFPSRGSADFVSNDPDDLVPHMVAYMRDRRGDLSGADFVGLSLKAGSSTRYYEFRDNQNGPAPDSGPTTHHWWYAFWSGFAWVDGSYSGFHDSLGTLGVEMPRPANMQPSSCMEIDGSDFGYYGLPNKGSYAQVPHFMYWRIENSVMDWGWCPEDDTAIQYLQNDEQKLHSFIDNIRMHDGTGTHYAMKYGLATLAPSSQPAMRHLADLGLVPEEMADRPSNWSTPEWVKYIVLMTDGQITDQFRPVDPFDPDNASVELERRPSSERNRITTASQNVNSFYQLCNQAKANGVVVYTIAFEAPSGAQREMQNCASSPSHFFDVQGTEIADAFRSIASQINQLRLTQ